MTVRPEGATTSEYLPPVMSNQLDSSNRMLGPKTCLGRHQLDCTCGMVATSFAAWVDVTGAARVCQRSRSAKRKRESVVQVPRQVGDASPVRFQEVAIRQFHKVQRGSFFGQSLNLLIQHLLHDGIPFHSIFELGQLLSQHFLAVNVSTAAAALNVDA